MSDDFQAELRFLGITSSPAFVRAPEGNGVAERFIRTLKEQLLWVRTFRTVEDLRVALQTWLVTYNEQWLVERHGFRSPAQVRRELLATQEAASACYVSRQSGSPRAGRQKLDAHSWPRSDDRRATRPTGRVQ